MTDIGMNLGQIAYWNDEEPTLDLMKGAGWWNPAANVLEVDEDDWPIRFTGKASCRVPMTDVPSNYMVRWLGAGVLGRTFRIGVNCQIIEQGTGWARIVASANPSPDSEATSNGLDIMSIDPADRLRNISIVREEYDARHQAGEVVSPRYIERLRGYGAVRFMDWLRTNEPPAKMPTMTQRTWFYGAPLEACLEAARQAGVVPYINLPATWTDAQIIAAALKCPPGTWFERVNEMWNSKFDFGKALFQQATKEVPAAVLAAQEQARVAKLLQTIGRKLLVGWQPTTQIKGWDVFNATLIAAGATKDNVSGVITSAYLYGGVNSLTAIKPYQDRNDIAGVAALLTADMEASIPLRFRTAQKLAGLLDGAPVVVYEGNVGHLNTSNGSNDAVAFVRAVQMDPLMRPIGRRLFEIAAQEGVALFMVFTLMSEATKYGFFGVKGTPFGEVVEERRLAKLTLTEAKPQSVLPDEMTINGRLYRAVSQKAV
jgi:hypothetical protein